MHEAFRIALAREITNDRIAIANTQRMIRAARPADPRDPVTARVSNSPLNRLRAAGRALHLGAR